MRTYFFWWNTMRTFGLVLILLLPTTTTTSASEHYLLSCGAPSTVSTSPSDYDSQTWQSDNNSTFSSDFSSTISSTSSTPSFNVPKIPFSTSRIFTSNFTYSFPVSPGPKFIRLFFYPSTNYSDSYLTLQSNSGHLLLRNFSAYLSTNSSYMFKEFYIHVSTSVLQLTFSPTPPSSHAFLNGIEIVSVPDTLYVGPTSPNNVASPGTKFELTNSTALETAYRLNVGGRYVSSNEDSGSMNRYWENDEQYLMGSFSSSTGIFDNSTLIKYTAATPYYTAPAGVYQTFRFMGKAFNEVKMRVNVTWGFQVDLGFSYLVRLHWCEVEVYINSPNYRVFDVYVNEQMADKGVDVFGWVGADTAVHRDYVVYTEGGSGSRGVLQLALHPNIASRPRY